MTDRDIQQSELRRVRAKLEAVVLAFASAHRRFRMNALTEAVIEQIPNTAPDSPGRILRQLRQAKRLNYRVVNRKDSLYEIIGAGLLFLRKHGKVDANQSDIVSVLRQVGASVQSLASVGDSCLDLLVGYRGNNYVMEVKMPKAKLKPGQTKWIAAWRGQSAVVRSTLDALVVIGVDAGVIASIQERAR